MSILFAVRLGARFGRLIEPQYGSAYSQRCAAPLRTHPPHAGRALSHLTLRFLQIKQDTGTLLRVRVDLSVIVKMVMENDYGWYILIGLFMFINELSATYLQLFMFMTVYNECWCIM